MTREQLDSSFGEYREAMVKLARKKCNSLEEAEDAVHTAYLKTAEGQEYLKVDPMYTKQFWMYKVRLYALRGRERHQRQHAAEVAFYDSGETSVDQELSEERAQQVIEGYWEGLNRMQQCRMRQKYAKEGIPLLPFMHPKK